MSRKIGHDLSGLNRTEYLHSGGELDDHKVLTKKQKDAGSVMEVKCDECTLFFDKSFKQCPYCDEYVEYMSFDKSDFALSTNHAVVYQKMKMVSKCYNDIAKHGHIVYVGKRGETLQRYYNEQVIHYEEKFEKLINDEKILEKVTEYTKQMKLASKQDMDDDDDESDDESDDEYDDEYDYKCQYLSAYHLADYWISETVVFKEVNCYGFSCDVCETSSTYETSNISHFKSFMSSRTPDSLLECRDPGCNCEASRERNYDYCKRCFFDLPRPKAERALVLARALTQFNVIDDIMHTCVDLLNSCQEVIE